MSTAKRLIPDGNAVLRTSEITETLDHWLTWMKMKSKCTFLFRQKCFNMVVECRDDFYLRFEEEGTYIYNEFNFQEL